MINASFYHYLFNNLAAFPLLINFLRGFKIRQGTSTYPYRFVSIQDHIFYIHWKHKAILFLIHILDASLSYKELLMEGYNCEDVLSLHSYIHAPLNLNQFSLGPEINNVNKIL
jgi:hypothetical protein